MRGVCFNKKSIFNKLPKKIFYALIKKINDDHIELMSFVETICQKFFTKCFAPKRYFNNFAIRKNEW